MTADRDQHGYTRAQLDRALAEPDDEPRERTSPEPDSWCTRCGWTGARDGVCHCDDGMPHC